jgi:hypothetical protein
MWSFAEFPGTYLTSITDAIRQVQIGEAPGAHRSFEMWWLAGQGTDNAMWMGGCHPNTETVTPTSPFVEIHEVTSAVPYLLHTQYALNSQRYGEATWATTNREAGVIGVELRAATNPIDIRSGDFKDRVNRRRVFKTQPISFTVTNADVDIITPTTGKQIYAYGIVVYSNSTGTLHLEAPTTDIAPVTLQAGEGYKAWVNPPNYLFKPQQGSPMSLSTPDTMTVRGWVAYWEDDN